MPISHSLILFMSISTIHLISLCVVSESLESVSVLSSSSLKQFYASFKSLWPIDRESGLMPMYDTFIDAIGLKFVLDF